jgi:ubiquinone/menaquinone biosynthesis C-methylase UbiE
MEERKRIEQDRYEKMARAAQLQQSMSLHHGVEHDGPLGAAAVDAPLRRPYLEYEGAVRDVTAIGARVLDLGAGTGTHSFAATGRAGFIAATDIAVTALRIARTRDAAGALAPVTADSEVLPFADGSFDVVTSAGILYCHDLPALTAEVLRVLAPGGHWVIVDSFDHNPVYRLNRLIGHLRGARTKLAVVNIPNASTVAYLRARFPQSRVSYHGIFAFAAPLLSRLAGPGRAGTIIDAADSVFPFLSRYAFKFVAVLQRA